MSRKVQLRSDLHALSSTSSVKRPRVNGDHEASIPEAKARKLDKRSISLEDIVPPLASGLALSQTTTTTQSTPNGGSSIPGPQTRLINRKDDAFRSVPVNRDPSTPGPHMGSFTVEKHSPAVQPVPTDRSPSTPGPHIGSFAVGKSENITMAHTDKATVSDTQTMDQVPKTTSHPITASEHSNPSTTYRDGESAVSEVQRTNEARGPIPIRNACGETSEPSLPLQNNRVSKAHAQPSVSAAALAHCRSSTLLNDVLRWVPTPYKLVEAGEDNNMCPRVEVFPDDGLAQILGEGRHPIATAIARIRSYGYKKTLPQKACHVLEMFDDIYRCSPGGPHITLIDPVLYNSDTHSQNELEAYRKKEWAWLSRAGKPITFPGKLQGSWDFVTIQSNYQRLEVALVLSRDNDLMTYLPGHPPPEDLEPIRVRSHLHMRSDIFLTRVLVPGSRAPFNPPGFRRYRTLPALDPRIHLGGHLRRYQVSISASSHTTPRRGNRPCNLYRLPATRLS